MNRRRSGYSKVSSMPRNSAYMTSLIGRSHSGHQAWLSTTDSSGYCPASGKETLPAGASGKWMPKRGKKGKGEKAGLNDQVTFCPSLQKDRMMDGVQRKRV